MSFDCLQVQQLLRRGATPAGPELALHLRDCPACAELLSGGEALGKQLGAERGISSGVSPELDRVFGQLQEALVEERGPRSWLRTLSTPTRVALLIGALHLVVLVGGVLVPRADMSAYSWLRMAAEVAAMLLLAAVGLAIWLRPLAKPALPRVLLSGLAGVAMLLPAVLAFLPVAHVAHPASLAGTGAALIPRALSCFIYGLVLVVPLAGLALALARDGGRWQGLAAAVGIGAVLALHLHCPITHTAHLLLGHATLPVAVVLLAVGLTRRARGRPLRR